MPRPKRAKIAPPSAPAQLPESLMKAIRADAAAGKEIAESTARRANVREASKPQRQDVYMSGALGTRNNDDQLEFGSTIKSKYAPMLEGLTSSEVEDQEVIASSMPQEETQQESIAFPDPILSTIQRPISHASAMFNGNKRVQATPRFDSSILGNFKRRPRKPSILGIGRQDDSSTLDNLDLGDSDPFDDDLEDFDPSTATPLIQNKFGLRNKFGSSIRKDISHTDVVSNPRKRKRIVAQESTEVLVPRSPVVTADDASHLLESSPTSAQKPTEDIVLPTNEIAPRAASRTSETSLSEVWSDTMAPPQSSPSDAASETKTSSKSPKRTTSRKTKAKPSPISAKSPLRTRSQQSRALKPISTAQLQNLLPLRRDRQHLNKDDSIDLTIAHANNEDEASFVPVKKSQAASRQPKTPIKTTSTRSKAALHDKTNTKRTITNTSVRKAITKPASAIKQRPTRNPRSRGNRVASGQENTPDPFKLPSTQDLSDTEHNDISTTSPSKATGDLDSSRKSELEAIVKKFAEVDEWEMEFEEAEDSSSGQSGLLLGSRS